jgi:hypothetical protein
VVRQQSLGSGVLEDRLRGLAAGLSKSPVDGADAVVVFVDAHIGCCDGLLFTLAGGELTGETVAGWAMYKVWI